MPARISAYDDHRRKHRETISDYRRRRSPSPAVVGSDFADAKRLGGGRSLGAQRQSIAPSNAAGRRPSTPAGAASQPVMPAQPGAAAPPRRPPPPPPTSGMSRWMGPIAGLAAGLGLAALLSHFGLSEGFASLLLIALLVVGVVLVVRMFLARRTPAKPAMQYAGPSGLDTKPRRLRDAAGAGPRPRQRGSNR